MSPRTRRIDSRSFTPSRAGGLAMVSALGLACASDPADAPRPWPSRRVALSAPDGGLALVANTRSNDLSVLDLGDARTVGRARIGADPVENDGPQRLVVDPIASRVFVTLTFPPTHATLGPHAAHGPHARVGALQALDLGDLRELARAVTDADPADLALTPDGRRVVVSHADVERFLREITDGGAPADSRLRVFDAQSLRPLAAIPVCKAMGSLSLDASGATAYVACYGDDALGIAHIGTIPPTVERIAVGPDARSLPSPLRYGPSTALLTRDQRFVLVGDVEGADVRVFDVAAHRFRDELAIPAGARVASSAESADGGSVVFCAEAPGAVFRVRRDDWRIDLRRPLTGAECQGPAHLARGPDGRFYLVCRGPAFALSRVLALDPNTLATVATFEVGVDPHAIAFVGRRSP